jgi:hypothetical protein
MKTAESRERVVRVPVIASERHCGNRDYNCSYQRNARGYPAYCTLFFGTLIWDKRRSASSYGYKRLPACIKAEVSE